MRKHTLPFVLVCLFSWVWSADASFSNYSSVNNEIIRLGSESREIATTPFDIEQGGTWGTLAVAGATGLVYVFDNDIRNRMRENKGNSLDKVAKAGSLVGNPLLHLGLAAAVYGGGTLADSARYKEVGVMMGEAALLADASTFVLKQVIGRARPEAGDRNSFRPLQFSTDYDSFPSMHTASSFAMASIIAGTSETLATKIASYSAALFVAFSRVYQEKHWASDVVLGAAIGELCGRVVMKTHVGESNRLHIAPVVSSDAVSLAIIGRW